MRTIQITSPDMNGETGVGLNGVSFKIPHNKTVSVSDPIYEILSRADLGTGKMAESDGEAAQVIGTDDDTQVGVPAAAVGTEVEQDPATPAAVHEGGNTLLGDDTPAQGHETAGGKNTGENVGQTDVDDQATGERRADHELGDTSGDAFEGGSTGGQQADSSQQSSEDSSDTFDADKFLDRPIKDMDADLADLTDDQRQQLVKAEKKRAEPRATLLTKLGA